MKRVFGDAVSDFLAGMALVEENELFYLARECNGEVEKFALAAQLEFTDLHIIVPTVNNGKDIYVTVTDGPVEDIAIILDVLQAGILEDVKTDRGDVLELNNSFLQGHGVFGMFFSRVKYYELFDDVSDTFSFEEQEYLVKAVVFLSKQETELFDKSIDEFYDIFDNKDVVQFSQLEPI